MSALFVTFTQNGMMKRAVVSQKQYNAYRTDKSIKDLSIHGSQDLMETSFNQANGIDKPIRQLLHG